MGPGRARWCCQAFRVTMSPRCCEVSVWPPDIKRLGGFRGWGRLSIHGPIKQDSLSMGYLWRRARHSHTPHSSSVHTHTLAVQLNALSFSHSISSPCVLQSHSYCLHINSRVSTHAHLSCQKDVQYIPVSTYHFHTTGVITYVYQ